MIQLVEVTKSVHSPSLSSSFLLCIVRPLDAVRRQHTLLKGPRVNMFGFVYHVVSLQLFEPAVCHISQGQHVKERMWLCSNTSLFMSIEM